MIRVESTGGTSSGDASGNPPVVSSPRFKSNTEILKTLAEDGFLDAGTPEALYVLDHVSYQHLLPYIKVLDSLPAWEQRTVNMVHNLLTFDRRMQSMLMKCIGIFEAQFRAQYLRAMASEHGPYAAYDGSLFLRPDNYEKSFRSYSEEVDKRISREKPFRAAFDAGRGRLPIWMGLECMTLGTLSALFSNTADKSVTGAVTESFRCTKAELTSWTKTITAVRNICAHFEPLFIRAQLPSQPKGIIGNTCPRRSPLYAIVLLSRLLEDMEFESYDGNLIYARRLEMDAREYFLMLENFCGGVLPLPSVPQNWRTYLHVLS